MQQIAPMIGGNLGGPRQLDAVEAHAVDLGNSCPILVEHQEMPDDRTGPGLHHPHVTPGDVTLATIKAYAIGLARDESRLNAVLLIRYRCERNLQTGVENRRMNTIFADYSLDRRRHRDTPQGLAIRGPHLGDTSESGTVGQSVGEEASVNLVAVDSIAQSLPRRCERDRRSRDARPQRHGPSDPNRPGAAARLPGT